MDRAILTAPTNRGAAMSKLLREMKAMNQEAIKATGDVDPRKLQEALQRALARRPRETTRELASYLSDTLAGCIPDV